MKRILKYKSDILAYISSVIIVIGTFLPIVTIDGVPKAFISENGKLVLACAVISAILYLFKVGFFSFIPAIGSLFILLVFYFGINDSIIALNKINPNSATYSVGLYLMIIGSALIIISSIINFIDNRKNNKLTKQEIKQNNDLQETKQETLSENINMQNDISLNLENNENIEKPKFKKCTHCGATIKSESSKCSFCDSKLYDNNM